MMVWLFNELTVGPNIGWSPTTFAFDFSMASIGFHLERREVAEELVPCKERGDLFDDPYRVADGDRDDDEIALLCKVCAGEARVSSR